MSIQKIVVVCQDEEYMNSIAYKLTEAFGTNAEFEYISEYSYFMKYMQVPQNIDILLIERDLYQEIVNKQNCKKVFFLVDNETMAENDREPVIFKYASIRSIIDTIDGQLLVHEKSDKSEMATKTISVYSPVGGSGKTTTSMGVAAALAKSGYKVLYISTECLQDYQTFFDDLTFLPDAVGYQCYMNQEMGAKMLLQYRQKREFDIIPPFSKSLTSYQITLPMMLQMIDYIKQMNLCDYIVVELSAEITAEKMNFLLTSDRIILVTQQEQFAVKKTKLFLRGVTDWKGQCVLLCNHYRKDVDNYLLDQEILARYEICEYVEQQSQPIDRRRWQVGDIFTKTALAVR